MNETFPLRSMIALAVMPLDSHSTTWAAADIVSPNGNAPTRHASPADDLIAKCAHPCAGCEWLERVPRPTIMLPYLGPRCHPLMVVCCMSISSWSGC
ncbi:hypothetical protein PHLGIDRAFT_460171 [Phlebiopsis gigantea 11061_1 CR5-6]|uniref:Uncharacterized protein n=1 Tax=Phlebiopsis gigantea (strain 11061_1 CR5-6) TaxID=745531 RepID=A0A0C3PJU2_PHLG1|nr:hypothetical protein PHLGIDRAFT_460171 [Phlebiopsis gigantea 11061_1 CR5-6]